MVAFRSHFHSASQLSRPPYFAYGAFEVRLHGNGALGQLSRPPHERGRTSKAKPFLCIHDLTRHQSNDIGVLPWSNIQPIGSTLPGLYEASDICINREFS